jgi:enterochelin esterase-like enzyme
VAGADEAGGNERGEDRTILPHGFPWRRSRDAAAPGRRRGRREPEHAGPAVDADSVTFRVRDPLRALTGVRLLQDARVPGELLDFARDGEAWTLRLPRPPVQRMEYRLELRDRDGGREEICDPDNPLRAPGPFGEKSVIEFPGYTTPGWLAAPRVDGTSSDFTIPSRLLGAEVPVQLWTPADAAPGEPLPLLLAHDGPDYARLAGLTAFSAALVETGRLPRHRVALLGPGDRDEWYAANVSYARALALAVLPALRRTVAVTGPVVGMGASLGALAMLHVQRRHGGVLGGMFLQSGSYFVRRLDQQESGSARFTRISRFVAGTLRGGPTTEPVPVTLTCGEVEENLANNHQLTGALLAQGYDARLVVLPDTHNYVGWRDAFDPALVDLLATVWAW